MRLVLPTRPSTLSSSMSFVASAAICCGIDVLLLVDVLDRATVDAAVVVHAVEVGLGHARDPREVDAGHVGGDAAELDRLAGRLLTGAHAALTRLLDVGAGRCARPPRSSPRRRPRSWPRRAAPVVAAPPPAVVAEDDPESSPHAANKSAPVASKTGSRRFMKFPSRSRRGLTMREEVDSLRHRPPTPPPIGCGRAHRTTAPTQRATVSAFLRYGRNVCAMRTPRGDDPGACARSAPGRRFERRSSARARHSAAGCCRSPTRARAWPRVDSTEPDERTALGDRWGAAGRQRPARQRRRGLPADGRPSSAIGSTGSPTVRPARGPTGSCGSTRCSARGPSSRSPARRRLATGRCRACGAATASRPTRCASSELGYARGRARLLRSFARRKRDGADPAALPVPGVAADAARADHRVRRARGPGPLEPLYEAAMLDELGDDLRRHPARPARRPVGHELRVRDARRRHADLVPDVRPASSSACVRLGRSVPADVAARLPLLPRPRAPPPRAAPRRRSRSSRSPTRSSLEPQPVARLDPPARAGRPRRRRFFETLGQLRAAARDPALPRRAAPGDGVAGATARIVAAQRFVHDFGVATDCGWGRHRPQDVSTLVELHRRRHAVRRTGASAGASFAWPPASTRCPTRTGRSEPVDDFGTAYDNVERHGWYRNLDPTVEELAAPAERRRHPDRLLGRHRHPARPAEAADLRPPGRARSSSTARRSSCASRSRTSATTRTVAFRLLRFLKDEKRLERSTRCSARSCSARRRPDRVDERDPPLPRPHQTPSRRGLQRASTGRARAHQLRQHPQPAREGAASGSSTRPCGSSVRSPRASCATTRVRGVPRRARRTPSG